MDNVEGKFIRTPPVVLNGSGVTENIHGYIRQLEVFDMDADGKSDIVTLDDSGEINILYGGTRKINETQTERIFTKRLVESGLGIRLSSEVRTDGGAFSYTGLVFPNQNTDASGNSFNPDNITGAINQGIIDNIVYYTYNYPFSITDQNIHTLIGSAVGGNMKKNPDGTYTDDAGNISYDAMSGSSLTGTIDYMQAVTNTALANEVLQMIENTNTLAGSGNADFSALGNTKKTGNKVFIRSPFVL